ncbi:MAG: DUF1684 domain-containing protein [Bacteroidota bacterium]|nr:DUF1684 domain-containing protein [Bacteroidota bacterium]
MLFNNQLPTADFRLQTIHYLIAIIAALFFSSCSKKHLDTSPSVPSDFISKLETHRAEVDSVMHFAPDSPFNRDTTVAYHGLNYFPPNAELRFGCVLHRYPIPTPTAVVGTKGEIRSEMKYGYFAFTYREKNYRLTVYKMSDQELRKHGSGLEDYLMVWFTDSTTGRETYPVGRYVDVERESPDPNFLYTLDFNYAYNPYCAYSANYSCAVPTKENALPFPVYAGEKKYHN